MTILYTIFDTLTHGYAVQGYFFGILILLVAMTIKGLWQLKAGTYISTRFGIMFAVMTIMFVGVSTWLILPTPTIVSPSLPLFDPILLSSNEPMTLVFDRPLDRDVQFEIEPPIAGMWQRVHRLPSLLPNNAIEFVPHDTVNQSVEHTVTIDNIASIIGNNYSKSNALLFVFTTERSTQQSDTSSDIAFKQPVLAQEPTPTPTPAPDEFRLDVPLIKQTNTFTCYSAAGRMALGYYGVDGIDEVEFVDMIGRDPTERNFLTSTWGDPNRSVVGTLDGSGPGGYGVHWKPVADVLNNYRSAEVIQNWNIPDMLTEVKNGYPVLVWWVNGVWPAKDVSWNLPSGESVYTVNGMHVEVVTGFQGSPENPLVIYTNDSWRGYRTYTPGQFANLWQWFDETAVVVR